ASCCWVGRRVPRLRVRSPPPGSKPRSSSIAPCDDWHHSPQSSKRSWRRNVTEKKERNSSRSRENSVSVRRILTTSATSFARIVSVVAGPEGVDGVGHPYVRVLPLEVPGDLQQAAGIGGEDGLGFRVQNVANLALAEALGHIGLGEVV